MLTVIKCFLQYLVKPEILYMTVIDEYSLREAFQIKKWQNLRKVPNWVWSCSYKVKRKKNPTYQPGIHIHPVHYPGKVIQGFSIQISKRRGNKSRTEEWRVMRTHQFY